MNTLGTNKKNNKQDSFDSKDIQSSKIYNREEISLFKAIFVSTIAHPAVVAFLWLLIKGFLMLLLMLGITLPVFKKPPLKIRDIEFVLVDKKDQPPINKNTKFRAERNSRAGGKHNPKKKVSPPKNRTITSRAQKAATQSKPRKPKKTSQSKQAKKAAPTKKATTQKQNPIPVPPRPTPTNSYPKPRVAKKTPFTMPLPKTKALGPATPQGGPITAGPIGRSSSGEAPSPIMSSSGYAPASKGRRASGYSIGNNNPGNPSPGNPHGKPGIDAIKEPDFGAYMSELQRRIKRNWRAPRDNDSKRVILIFKVSRDGRLLSLKVKQSSGNPEADRAAKAAVELSAPFRRLPPEYKGNSVDIDFTFDYNVIGITGKRYY